nr:hypothetical protein Josef01_02j05_52 [uncultured archaeon]
MSFEAKVISLQTRPYTEAEMNELSHEEYGRVKHGRLEKVIGEEVLANIVTEDKEEIRRRVIEIADKTNPRPIIVITDAFPDSYLVGRQCHHKSRDAIFEQILFEYNPDHWSRTQQQTPIPRKKTQAEKEATQKAYPDNMAEVQDEMLAAMNQKVAENFGMYSHDQFLKYMQDSMRKAALSGIDEKEAIKNMQKEMMDMYYQHGGKGAYAQLENPKETLKNTTIQFRVIGRNDYFLSDYARYYSRFHNFHLRAATANIIADLVASFSYPEKSQ